jgi:hypothetical protein
LREFLLSVMAGLDPAIHVSAILNKQGVDARVKPDMTSGEFVTKSRLAIS